MVCVHSSPPQGTEAFDNPSSSSSSSSSTSIALSQSRAPPSLLLLYNDCHHYAPLWISMHAQGVEVVLLIQQSREQAWLGRAYFREASQGGQEASESRTVYRVEMTLNSGRIVCVIHVETP